MRKTTIFIIFAAILLLYQPQAEASKAGKGALIGGGIGLIAGGGKGAAKGALLGGGVGALSSNRNRGAKRGASKGAAVGAGIGLITGGGLSGAAKGAVYGGATGAIIGDGKKKKRHKKHR